MHTLHYTTLHYITLLYITLHYTALHYTTKRNPALHCIALHLIALHCIALHYITLHYITLHYITLHYITCTYACVHMPRCMHTHLFVVKYIRMYICICRIYMYEFSYLSSVTSECLASFGTMLLCRPRNCDKGLGRQRCSAQPGEGVARLEGHGGSYPSYSPIKQRKHNYPCTSKH